MNKPCILEKKALHLSLIGARNKETNEIAGKIRQTLLEFFWDFEQFKKIRKVDLTSYYHNIENETDRSKFESIIDNFWSEFLFRKLYYG